MKTLLLLGVLAALPLAAQCGTGCGQCTPPALHTVPAAESPRIADSVGRAGMVASLLPGKCGAGKCGARILMTGGANFPQAKPGAKTPAERGPKVFYDDVLVFDPATGSSETVGKLPYAIGYAAHTSHLPGRMILAGGCNMEGHTNRTLSVSWHQDQFSVQELPALPLRTAYPAFVQARGKLYVFGGQENADSTACLNRSFVLDLSAPEKGWAELAPMPGEGRMLAAAGTCCRSGNIYITGGCSLHPDAKGQAERTYLKSTLCYNPATNTWSTAADMPETIVAPATPMPATRAGLLVIGGDPGNFYRASLAGTAPAIHPGQNTAVYAFCPQSGTWKKYGENSIGIATAPAVKAGCTIYTISGETHPGVRTPVITTLQLKK